MMRHISVKNRAINLVPLSCNTVFGGPETSTKFCANTFTTDVAVMRLGCKVQVSFVNRSVITKRNLFPLFVRISFKYVDFYEVERLSSCKSLQLGQIIPKLAYFASTLCARSYRLENIHYQ